jgi:hypothetical protein
MYTKENHPALLDALHSPLFMSKLLYHIVENYTSAHDDEHPVHVGQVNPFKAEINYAHGMATVNACVEARHMSDVRFRVYVADNPDSAKANGILAHNANLKSEEIEADWSDYDGLNGGGDPRINGGLPAILVVDHFPPMVEAEAEACFDEFVTKNGIEPISYAEIQALPLNYWLDPDWFDPDKPDSEVDFSLHTC